MKKRLLAVLCLALTAVGCCTLGACKDKGGAGKSAYDIWLDAGNTGTEEEFLEWLKGAQGDQGAQGTEGKSAYQT